MDNKPILGIGYLNIDDHLILGVTERKTFKKRKNRIHPGSRGMLALLLAGILFFIIAGHPIPAAAKKQITIGILMANDTRQNSVNGFKDGMTYFANTCTEKFTYTILNADNQKHKLPTLANEIIEAKPNIAVAAGGIEADALLVATRGTDIPVVFLAVSSSIDRGLSSNMTAPDKNITGIETNDTNITAKRMWFIKRILPGARKIFCFHMPSNVASVESIKIARKKAKELGLELVVKKVETVYDIRSTAQMIFRENVDVILLNPVAVIDGALKEIILPRAMEQKIPVFGYGMAYIEKGAFASYAGSRYLNGKQAARLAHKIVHGESPRNIPIETPEKYEFIINTWMVKKLGLTLPPNMYKMADKIVEIEF
ncbi:ABC transporter substrate-binding protein [Desulfobacter curvatus]|uniref:ABC transporter substrate-binding protein n=1 Tax=Desulfobacter curvatus TaxID=2290 RepID=UPI00036A497C|nr:ABC transporter substrate-binding protein [Desulfobacter curvatus]